MSAAIAAAEQDDRERAASKKAAANDLKNKKKRNDDDDDMDIAVSDDDDDDDDDDDAASTTTSTSNSGDDDDESGDDDEDDEEAAPPATVQAPAKSKKRASKTPKVAASPGKSAKKQARAKKQQRNDDDDDGDDDGNADGAATAADGKKKRSTERSGGLTIAHERYRQVHFADMTPDSIAARRALWKASDKTLATFARHPDMLPQRDVDVVVSKISTTAGKVQWVTSAPMNNEDIANKRVKRFTPVMVSKMIGVQKEIARLGLKTATERGLFDGTMPLPTDFNETVLNYAYKAGMELISGGGSNSAAAAASAATTTTTPKKTKNKKNNAATAAPAAAAAASSSSAASAAAGAVAAARSPAVAPVKRRAANVPHSAVADSSTRLQVLLPPQLTAEAQAQRALTPFELVYADILELVPNATTAATPQLIAEKLALRLLFKEKDLAKKVKEMRWNVPYANLSHPANPFFNNVLQGKPNDVKATGRPETMSTNDADRYALNLTVDAAVDLLERVNAHWNDIATKTAQEMDALRMSLAAQAGKIVDMQREIEHHMSKYDDMEKRYQGAQAENKRVLAEAAAAAAAAAAASAPSTNGGAAAGDKKKGKKRKDTKDDAPKKGDKKAKKAAAAATAKDITSAPNDEPSATIAPAAAAAAEPMQEEESLL